MEHFEWDPVKEAVNLAKHGLSFGSAAKVLAAGHVLVYRSDRGGEARWVGTGAHEETGKVVAIVYTLRRGGGCRIISARRARQNEEEAYWRRAGA
ncbi:MAG: BrnT family toxin [Gemmatimonadaceae bacterium]|nr:BrnT family toxin [Gemmatimonadaceae bacterium]